MNYKNKKIRKNKLDKEYLFIPIFYVQTICLWLQENLHGNLNEKYHKNSNKFYLESTDHLVYSPKFRAF